MQKRKFDELVSYFNKKVSEMEIETKYKMELLGMVTALGCAHEKEMSDLSETKRDSSDTISRNAAIEALEEPCKVSDTWTDEYAVGERAQWEKDVKALNSLPSAQLDPHYDEWCMDCKEYDQERHCCPRYNRVIREAVEEVKEERIFCKDCKWYLIEAVNDYCRFERCLLSEQGKYPDDYCSRAERKEEHE